MPYERRNDRLLTHAEFAFRVARHFLFAIAAIAGALGTGVVGYRYFAHLGWIDALLNASMILGGMGPVDALQGTGAKVFASMYALFSGLVFIALLGFILAPFVHRLLHRFHFEDEADDEEPPRDGKA